jgi:hypothetical protein
MKALITCLLFLLLPTSSQAAIIFIEDFEDDKLTYTASSPDALLDIGNNDYYGRLNATSQPSNLSYDNRLGNGYYGVQDTDGAEPSALDVIDLYWNNIDISQWENLALSWFIAEGDSRDGNEDIDSSTRFTIMTQIDGNGFTNLFAVASTGTNTAPQIDTDFDGLGDGSEITNIFTQYFQTIATGTLLDIKVSFENFDAADEDFAFDHLTLTGDVISSPGSGATNIPEPPVMILVLIALYFSRVYSNQNNS